MTVPFQVYKTPYWRKRKKGIVEHNRTERDTMSPRMRALLYRYTQEIREGTAHKAVEAEMVRNTGCR